MPLPALAARAGQAIGTSGAKKIIGLVLGLVGLGLGVVAIGQWNSDDGKSDQEKKSFQDKMVASLQWGVFAVLLVFVAYKLFKTESKLY